MLQRRRARNVGNKRWTILLILAGVVGEIITVRRRLWISNEVKKLYAHGQGLLGRRSNMCQSPEVWMRKPSGWGAEAHRQGVKEFLGRGCRSPRSGRH